MRNAKIILFFGFVISVTPFLGFPGTWKNMIFLVLGVSIMVLTFNLTQKTKEKKEFEENNQETEDEEQKKQKEDSVI